MKWLLLFIPFILFGANEANKTNYFKVLMEHQNPYIFDKRARLELQKAQLEAKTKEKIANIEYKKEIDKEKIKKEAVEIKSKSEIEKKRIAITPQEKMVQAREKLYLYAFLFGLLFLIIIYLIFKKYQTHKEKMELEKMRLQQEIHEKEMAFKEKEIQAQIAGKLIDAVASGKLSPEQEEKLLSIASGNTHLLKKD